VDVTDDPAARAAARPIDGRQRVLAAMVVVAAALLVYSLSGGPWARATVGGGDGDGGDGGAQAKIELRLSGEVDVDPDGAAVGDDLADADADGASAERQVVEESMGGTTRDLVQVLAVLILVVAAVGLVLDLRSRLWGLLASASLVCLLAATVLRDSATEALARGVIPLGAGPVAVDSTGWSALAIGAAAVAALASFLATAERGVAARSGAPVLGPDPAVFDAGDGTGPGDFVDPTPPGAPGPAARPDPARRRRSSTPAGRVRARLLNSLPSRGGR
jgi:hypothetical protein